VGNSPTELFDRQEGVATREQLLTTGLTARVIDRRLATGRYRRIHRNVYALGPLSMRGRLIAGLLAGGEDAALCVASALVPFGLRKTVVTVDVAVKGRRTDTDKLRFHRLRLADDEVTRRDGLRVTTIERTLFDIAATGADIRKLAQEALAKRLTTRRRRAHTRSDLERRFRRFLDAHGLPQPERNHPLGPSAHEFTFEEDRARDRFLAGLGLRTMRVTEQSLRNEATLRQEVRRAARIVR
jgi:hypothetical protein